MGARDRHQACQREKGRADDKAAEHHSSLTNLEALHSDNTNNLRDRTAECKSAAEEHRRSQEERSREIDAVGQAKAILSGNSAPAELIQDDARRPDVAVAESVLQKT